METGVNLYRLHFLKEQMAWNTLVLSHFSVISSTTLLFHSAKLLNPGGNFLSCYRGAFTALSLKRLPMTLFITYPCSE